MATTTKIIVGSDANRRLAFEPKVTKDHPMSIPSGCLCTWVVKVNRVWYLKYESNICPFRGRH